ncbi:hypothetical protein CROQUDRAFT_725134, partial [Cronartium quercuum f. sp. fusiforme G11]
MKQPSPNHVTLNYPDPSSQYTRMAIKIALTNTLPHLILCTTSNGQQDSDPKLDKLSAVQISDYDLIDWDPVQRFPQEHIVNAYPIRKALIRKNYLAKTLHFFQKKFVPETWAFELAYADELDELWIDELYTLSRELESVGNWFILKPALAERGQGIRLFDSKESLELIFEEFENEEDEREDEKTRVIASRMRHWVIQRYISNPLLVGPSDMALSKRRKHHLRVYVLAVGALSVYVYKDILALFAAKPYSSPPNVELASHLTNTCLQYQAPSGSGTNVRLLANLAEWGVNVEEVEHQVDELVGKTFAAAAREPIHFQTRKNCWEIFGVDIVLDEHMKAWLLEVNACPDFAQTGDTLAGTIVGLFEGALAIAVKPFLDGEEECKRVEGWKAGGSEVKFGYRKCMEVDLLGALQ